MHLTAVSVGMFATVALSCEPDCSADSVGPAVQLGLFMLLWAACSVVRGGSIVALNASLPDLARPCLLRGERRARGKGRCHSKRG